VTVAEYLAQFLVRRKVRHVFGLQGGAILKLVDEVMATGQISYVQNFHEQASAFCADACARVTGNVGVAFATSGPGATNLVTGIANAQLDSVPTLFITGQEYSSRLQKKEGVRSNGFQDLDIVRVVTPITKYATTVVDATRIAYELEKAWHLATSGRPGAVLLDIPIDLQFVTIDPGALEHFVPPLQPLHAIQSQDIAKFLALLKTAERPMILGGGGVALADARSSFAAFAKLTNVPVALTLNGLDVYENFLGFSGLYGNIHSALAVYNADLLIVLGARLGQHQVGKSKDGYTRAKVVHVDIDELELERCMAEDLSIHADLKSFLNAVNTALNDFTLPDYSEWHRTIAEWQQRYPVSLHERYEMGISPLLLISEAQRYFKDNAVVVSDVGQNQMWVAQALRLRSQQRLLNSSGLGSMGYALPAAIAAKLCKPDSTIVAFMGDGGFQINLQELQLLALRKLNIKLFVLNNGTLGLIKTAQDKYFGDRHYGSVAPDFGCPSLEHIARAYGLNHYKIETSEDLSQLEKIFEDPCAGLVDVMVDPAFPLLTRHDMKDIFALCGQ